MKRKKLLQTLCLAIFFIFSSVLDAQQTQPGITLKDVIPWGITILIFIIGTIWSVQQVKRKKKAELEAEMKFKQQKEYFESQIFQLKQKKFAELEAQKEFDNDEQISAARTDEEKYHAALKEELGRIDLLGSPNIESKAVKLEDAFVSLCISESWRCEELQPKGSKMTEQEWEQRQKKRADQQAQAIIDFLKAGENKAVRDLAAVPMLLQIMAVIWKERKHLPHNRMALYDAALNYLLAYRDKARDIEPLLPVEQSRSVLEQRIGSLILPRTDKKMEI